MRATGHPTAVTESAELTGRAVVTLWSLAAPELAARSGKPFVVAELASELGFTDTDGSVPASLRRPKR